MTYVLRVRVQVIEKCSVTAIETYTDDYGVRRLRSVQTNRGNIKSNTLVNCAGLYALSVIRFTFLRCLWTRSILLLALLRHIYMTRGEKRITISELTQ